MAQSYYNFIHNKSMSYYLKSVNNILRIILSLPFKVFFLFSTTLQTIYLTSTVILLFIELYALS